MSCCWLILCSTSFDSSSSSLYQSFSIIMTLAFVLLKLDALVDCTSNICPKIGEPPIQTSNYFTVRSDIPSVPMSINLAHLAWLRH